MTVRVPASILCMMLLAAGCGAPPDAFEPTQALAQARRLDTDGQQDAAIELYRQVLARAPNSFDAHYGVARALDLKGSYADARDHFAAAIELAPDDGSRDQALRMMGVSWTFVGDARQAAPFFTQVFDRRAAAGDVAGASEVANELGRVLLELGDVNGAHQWYRTGHDTAMRQPQRLERDEDLADFRWAHAQARIAIRRGDADEAGKHAAVAQSLIDKGTNPEQRIQYPYLTGYIAFHAKEYARAVGELQQADQQDPFILLLLAQAHEQTGDAAQAREYYGKVLASNSHAVSNAFARPVARRALMAR